MKPEVFVFCVFCCGAFAQNAGANTFSQTGIDRVAGLYVTGAAGTLLASAGRDMSLVGAQVSNQGTGNTTLSAGNKLSLGTVKTEQSQSINWNANNDLHMSSSAEVGTQISGGGGVSMTAQQDVSLRAAQVNAQSELSVSAKQGSVTIEAGQSSESLAEARQAKSSGFASSKTTTTLQQGL